MAKELFEHKIIILVPFRNPGDYIVDCVNSILAQQYTHYEVYLLDDNSDDHSFELIQELLEATDHFHYVKREKEWEH